MSISLQAGLKQTQKLVLTQSLKQAIELLQLSTIELYERIESELIENPVIEEEGGGTILSSGDISSTEKEVNRNLSLDESTLNRAEERQINYGNFSDSGYASESENDQKRNYLENVVAQEESLTEHLLWQARLIAGNNDELAIYEDIITSLDDNGFLTRDINTIAAENNTSGDSVRKVLDAIQLLDPVGCAVKDVQESLVVQCRFFYPEDTELLKVLSECFVEFEKLDYEKIARVMNMSVPAVLDKSKLIQNLDPFPGKLFSNKKARYIYPDIDIKLVDGEIIITLNDEWLPSLHINNYYVNILNKKSIEKNLKDYIQDKLQSARYLIKNISSRRNTIIKVVSAIMDNQRVFLERGPGHLKPLTHFDIAEKIEMHESTVSRVAAGKFVQTCWGVFELKDFFVSRLKSEGNKTDTSSDRVMSLIRDIVDQENPAKPHSDEEIVNILDKSGISVARRTVAKYRGILDIPPSSKRKKLNMIKKEDRL